MKPSRFTEEQIIGILREHEAGAKTADNVLSNRPVNNIFSGINVDVAVRDTDAWIFRVGYNITLLGKIVFIAPPF